MRFARHERKRQRRNIHLVSYRFICYHSRMEDTKTNQVIVNVVLDRSGSMNSTRANTISGYNEYVQGLRADKDSEYSVTLIQFDAPMAAPELTVSYQDRALADVPELTLEDYVPRGNTPLYDAIGECVRRVDAKDRAVIVLIITDGAENASLEFTKETVKALIKQKESEGWTFAFLGANIDSYAVGSAMGMAAGNIANYTAGNEQKLYANMARSTANRMGAVRLMGLRAAVKLDFVDDNQRQDILKPGGRPAVPPSFRPKPPQAPPVGSPRRDWTVKSPVPRP